MRAGHPLPFSHPEETRNSQQEIDWSESWAERVQLGAVFCTAGQCNALNCSAVQCISMQCSAVQCSVEGVGAANY